MPSARNFADALVDEFKRRNIGANVCTLANEYACNADINNMPVRVYVSTDVNHHPDIRWTSNTTTHRIPNCELTPSDLAEQVIDTFLNPA